jgi:hypothetical protein
MVGIFDAPTRSRSDAAGTKGIDGGGSSAVKTSRKAE